ALDRWFCNLLHGAIRGVTRVCSSLNSWRVQSPGWFRLWAFNLVELRVEVLFPHCVDPAGSAGVLFGPTLVSSSASALLEFLLL
ncbi:hypothetical protein Taro_015950, partial [Colocasia esculenta]|nr:hypothetical protein [Colocasia esculenta]